MALQDAMKGGGDDGGPAMALSIKAEPLDAKHAAAQLLKAIEAKDVNGIDDALRLHYAACEDEEDQGGGDEDDGEDNNG